MTKCNQCKKEGQEFYLRPNGRPSQPCKTCRRAYQSEYDKSEAGIASRKRYRETVSGRAVVRKAQKKYAQSEAGKEARRRFDLSPKGRASMKRRQDRYKAKHPERVQAWIIVRDAIRCGQLDPASKHLCVHCQDPAVHWHHTDYNYPLEVVAVCYMCHAVLTNGGG